MIKKKIRLSSSSFFLSLLLFLPNKMFLVGPEPNFMLLKSQNQRESLAILRGEGMDISIFEHTFLLNNYKILIIILSTKCVLTFNCSR